MQGKPELDTRDRLILKGLAILAISFHNYFHLLSGVQENEFTFNRQRFFNFLGALHQPSGIVQASSSFFGHYGVQIFVFLSAYGLAVRYWEQQPRWTTFVWGRIRKLYPTFLLAMALWALFVGLPLGLMGPFEVLWRQSSVLLLTTLGIVNLVPGAHASPVGPWWYLPFIMQIYCLWPLLRRFAILFGPKGLWALSVGSMVLTYATYGALSTRWGINILETPLAHLPECCLGIEMARYGYRPRALGAAASAVVFLLSNLLVQFWLLSFISGLVLMLWTYQQLRSVIRRFDVLAQVGGYSTALFFVNGFIRLPFVLLAARLGIWYFRLLFGLESFSLGLAVALLLTVATSGQLRQAAARARQPEFA